MSLSPRSVFWSAIRLVSMVPVAIAAYFIFGFNLLHLDDVSLSSFLPFWCSPAGRSGSSPPASSCVTGLAPRDLPWSLAFLLMPLCCVFYPVSVLPDWLQPVALALPPTHVFEGMRSILLNGIFDATDLWWAISLNAVYLLVGYVTFSWGSWRARGSMEHYSSLANRRHNAVSLSPFLPAPHR